MATRDRNSTWRILQQDEGEVVRVVGQAEHRLSTGPFFVGKQVPQYAIRWGRARKRGSEQSERRVESELTARYPKGQNARRQERESQMTRQVNGDHVVRMCVPTSTIMRQSDAPE